MKAIATNALSNKKLQQTSPFLAALGGTLAAERQSLDGLNPRTMPPRGTLRCTNTVHAKLTEWRGTVIGSVSCSASSWARAVEVNVHLVGPVLPPNVTRCGHFHSMTSGRACRLPPRWLVVLWTKPELTMRLA